MSGNLNRQLSAQEFDAKLSLADFIVGNSDDPLIPPLAFTQWREAGAWEASIYEPEMLATADARTIINYEGRPRSVINLCSYNYLGLANHPEVIGAARDALAKYGLGACGSPLLSGMTDLHRQLEHRVAGFLRREDAMLFNSGFGGALGTISGLLRNADPACLWNIFEGIRRRWRFRVRRSRDTGLLALLRTLLRLFMCPSAGYRCCSLEGARHRRT